MSNEEMFASKESALQVLSEIIAIPSVKSDPTPDAPFGEATVRALDYLLGIGKDMGFHTEMIDHKVGYIEWGDSGAITAILCHLDVVPAGEGWSADPFHLRRENGLLIGRGVVDDKGPAVAALFAMKRLKESGFTPCGRIRLILGLDEESGSLCMERYKETEEFPRRGFTPDASFPVIFAEKGILHIRVSGPGSSSIHVAAGERPNMVPAACRVTLPLSGTTYEVLGVPAHASTPHVGENAIARMISQLPEDILASNQLLTFFKEFIGFDTTGEFLSQDLRSDAAGNLTLNAGILRIDASSGELWIDIRYPVSKVGENVFREISDAAAKHSLRAEILSHALPLHKDTQDPLIESLMKVYHRFASEAFAISGPADARLEEQDSTPVAIGGGTYARSMPGLVAFGPQFPWDKDQAHCVDESVNEEIFYLFIDLYAEAIQSLSESV